ncbi:MAG: glucosamine-6-phosphate deaminase [Armatimonadota bacterium]|nr:glucosamine-6-phosphate deaminase [Armatimonadota bacterium]MCX7778102.1 glucosamine-6-phosphate deaminase [Armatimonadota bacterium]MDW8026163.1 glucosamine-6-phosphate deaminase [Armatimonadota bacterium]
MSVAVTLSRVEQIMLERTGEELMYPPTEKIGVIVVDNFPMLGKLTALRFIEWVQQNPGGVIALPTGKTPEYFIKWVQHYIRNWDDAQVAYDLEAHGVDPSIRPDIGSLHFVQIDEFYPIEPTHHNSFNYYVRRFYIDGFGLDPKKAMLIDCTRIGMPHGFKLEDIFPDYAVDLSLRYRRPKTNLERLQKEIIERVDQWCEEYEAKIRGMGGIGFFLGGIGPDGHIAFNIAGSSHHSTTRLTVTNYETQAAAAVDLGGIEVAKRRAVITIGLATITHNPNCVAIIIAAGDVKAKVVRDAIESEPSINVPATALHKLPNARFYITTGAAKLLTERQINKLKRMGKLPEHICEQLLIDLAIKLRKRITDLTLKEIESDRFASLTFVERSDDEVRELLRHTEKNMKRKIEDGMQVMRGVTFLHTAPHHDDIELGYLAFIVRHVREPSNKHHFAYMTSGFTSVTNSHMLKLMEKLKRFLSAGHFDGMHAEGYFRPDNTVGRNRDVWQFLDGVASGDEFMKDEGEARRILRILIEVFEEENLNSLRNRVDELIHYFKTQYPGRKDLPHIQRIKGMVREWESECMWGYFGFDCTFVHHLRLGFYTGDIFSEEPVVERDVIPVLELIQRVKPDIVTVALDPEAAGPDAHYKVMQIIAEALKMYEREDGRRDLQVIGYRNVWTRFHPSEADIFVPVSLNMFAILQNSFKNAFASQWEASFPSYEYEGPFSELAQLIQVEQYRAIKTCLGREFFYFHTAPLIRATRGILFLRKMSLEEFYQYSGELRRAISGA